MNQNPVLGLLKSAEIEFSIHTFEYLPGGGTARSSSMLGIKEGSVVKSLIFTTDDETPILVLMHGDKRVDTKKLAQIIGTKRLKSCAPDVAELWSGWPVGSTNPFILKSKMLILLEASILALDKIWINGGGRGLLVSMNPSDLEKVIQYKIVSVGT